VRDALVDWGRVARERCGGRPTPPDKIHLTLLFVGNVQETRLDGLKAAAAAAAGARFELTFDRLEYWRHNRIVWAGATSLPPALVALVSRLEKNVQDLGHHFDPRPYAAHVTLLRNARPGELFEPPALLWHAKEFVLVQSVLNPRGSRYSVIARWPLAAA
jgi:2'-5' RNA ligase